MRVTALWALAGLTALVAAGSSPALPSSAQTVEKYRAAASLQLPSSLAGGTLGVRELSGAVAADASGNVYVGVCASDFRHRIVVFDKTGAYVRDFEAGACGTGESVKIAVGPDGLLYATRIGPNDEIGVFTPEGALVRLIGGIGRLNTITARDIDLDRAGNVYVTIRHDTSDGGPDNDEVVRLSPSGSVTGRWVPLPPPYLCNGQCLEGVAAADDGSVWVTTTDPNRELMHLDANGRVLGDAPHLDVLLSGLAANQVRDVDFANGRLFVVGHTKAFAAFSPSGRLVDRICCEHTPEDLDRQVALAGTNALVPGFGGATVAVRPAAGPPPLRVVKFASVQVKIGRNTTAAPQETCFGEPTVEEGPFGLPLIEERVTGVTYSDCTIVLFEYPSDLCPPNNDVETDHVEVGDATLPKYWDDEHRKLTIQRSPYSKKAIIVYVRTQPGPTGSILLFGDCRDRGTRAKVPFVEWKGDVERIDPSGNAIDAVSKRPIDAAAVRLEFSTRRTGPFVKPGPSGYLPESNPEITHETGAFAWDVAAGYWRLRVRSFGFRPYSSPVYHVPPAVTGLRLELRRDPRRFRYRIDLYGGAVGTLRVRGRIRTAKAPRGLRLRVARHRIVSIKVVSKRFRTPRGIAVGSRDSALFATYSSRGAQRLPKPGKVAHYRVGRAIFELRRGRVVSITLVR